MQKVVAQKFEDFRYWFHHEELFIDQVRPPRICVAAMPSPIRLPLLPGL